jgi:protein TonB
VKLQMTRVSVIVVVTTVVNLLLFSAMQAMVRQERVRLTEAEDLKIANFIRMSDLEPPTETRRNAEPPSKPRPEEQSRINQLVDTAGSGLGGTAIDTRVDFDFGGAADGSLGGSGGVPMAVRMVSDLVVLVRVPPTYPRTALARGIEGHVDVLFTVTETGNVANPSVLSASPPGVFEDVTLAAVSRWRFQPEVRNGRPVAIPCRNRFTFRLADSPG